MKKIKKRTVVLLLLLVMALADVAMIGFSLAKYVDVHEQSAGASVVTVSPDVDHKELTFDKLGASANIGVMSKSESTKADFIIDNSNSACSVVARITVTTEQKLPLRILLYPCLSDKIGEHTPLTPIPSESSPGCYVFECDVAIAKADFCVIVEWDSDEYDEVFNEIIDRIKVSIVCEQKG